MNRALLASLLAIAAAGCSDGAAAQRVSEADYAQIDQCWIGKNGEIEAFLVLGTNETTYVPYFVSKKCYWKNNNRDASFDNMAIIKIYSDNGKIRDSLNIDKNFGSNTISDIIPSLNFGNVYILRADVEEARVDDFPDARIYSIHNISMIKDTGVSLDRFAAMEHSERDMVWAKTFEK